MNITINDKPHQAVAGATLAQIMTEKGISPAGIAVAVNGRAVNPSLWDSTLLSEGDSIIIFKAFYGG